MVREQWLSCNVLNVKVSMNGGELWMQWPGGPEIWWIYAKGIGGKLGEKKAEIPERGSRKGPDERDWEPY